KLLHAIFGRAGEDVKNDSLEVPSGVEGIVIHTQRFSRRASMSEDERKAFDKEQKELETRYAKLIADQFRAMVAELGSTLGQKELNDPVTGKALASDKDDKIVAEQAAAFIAPSPTGGIAAFDIRSPERQKECQEVYDKHQERLTFLIDDREHKLN